jgi:16S rRNA (uracil1498-N3)-methyltransferase
MENDLSEGGRARLFFCPESDRQLAAGDRIVLDEQESRHVLQVLRARKGERLRLTDGCGTTMTARLTGRRDERAEVKLEQIVTDSTAAATPRLVLACAVLKSRRFEWVLEKAVELGAHRVVPLAAEHTVVRPRAGKQTRWAGLLRNAVKQSGRSFLPVLTGPRSLADLLADPGSGPLIWGAAPPDRATDDQRPLRWWQLVRFFGPGRGRTQPAALTLLIGPEGGWSAGEREQLHRAGAVPVDFGPHVLRAETAAVAGLLAAQAVRQAWLAPEGGDAVQRGG